ncbi:hypothetical protein [Umezawaea sp. NPDC059074]|uniref:hypothetical protein n=1 Tax=Umezawaea sp. NPDC059074 TaxID=3346716 RepID=UPI0036CE8195
MDEVVRCREFPITNMTSNGEREFPPAFLWRCLRPHFGGPTTSSLAAWWRPTSMGPT